MKYRTEIFNDGHIKYLEDWLEYFRKKGYKNNYTIEDFKLDRLDCAWISFYKDNFLAFSGIEDVSQWIPNTYRVLTRTVTTNVCDEIWRGHGCENNFYAIKLQVPFQVLYAKSHKPEYNVILSNNAEVTDNVGTDASFRLARYMNNPKNFSDFYDYKNIRIEEIWYTKQYVYDINCDYIVKLGEEFFGKRLL